MPLRAAGVVLLLLIHLALGAARWSFITTYDGAEYLQMAQNILSKGSFTYDGANPVVGKPPGFPAILAAYVGLVGSPDGFQHVQMVFLFLTFLLVAATVARVLGPNWAWGLLTALVIVNPLQSLTYNLMSEPAFFFLTSIAIYSTLRLWESGRMRWALAAGAAYGLSAYVRPVNLLWPFALLVVFWLVHRRRWRWAALILVTHILVVAPWLARNAVQFHRFVPMVANWGLLYYMADPNMYQILHAGGVADVMRTSAYNDIVKGECQFNWGPSERFRRAALAGIRADPGGYLRRCVHQSFFAWTFIPGTRGALTSAPYWFLAGRVLMFAFYVVTAVGAYALWRRSPVVPLMLVGYSLVTALVLFPFRTESRYLILPYLWLCPLAVAGLRSWLLSRIRPAGHRWSPRNEQLPPAIGGGA